jgi:hypothetical protein
MHGSHVGTQGNSKTEYWDENPCVRDGSAVVAMVQAERLFTTWNEHVLFGLPLEIHFGHSYKNTAFIIRAHYVKSPVLAPHNAFIIRQAVALVCSEALCLSPDWSHVQFERRCEVHRPRWRNMDASGQREPENPSTAVE